ncbi:hypothetical protein PS691_03475 [Pseudomonas fluorescens]|uniref:Uncharacterized protein n=1 Tax=Pseudomonas fluorescens TaxID=294 RepID=A0A5E7D3A0_PSEFL|nr:hypothetical protein PS691_03475 [Pseudomonas fluorescens]
MAPQSQSKFYIPFSVVLISNRKVFPQSRSFSGGAYDAIT